MQIPASQGFHSNKDSPFRTTAVRHWPLWVALVSLWVSTGVLQFLASLQTHGRLIYTLDDAYIHMAMAKNIALHGVYGVTRYEFSSSSSSPLWTLLLAAFYSIFGVHESFPLILALLIASGALIVAYAFLYTTVKNQIGLMLVLMAIVFLTPLPVLISSGMEHPLHILLAFMFIGFFARTITDDAAARNKSTLPLLCLLSGLLVLTRFESYALVLIVCIIYALRRRWVISLGVVCSAMLPLVVYQAISVAHGWSWLPNSILVRGNIHSRSMFNSIESMLFVPWTSPHFLSFILGGWRRFLVAPHIAALVGTAGLVLIISWARSKRFWKSEHMVLVAYILAAIAHLQFGRTGHFFRYDAYLVAVGIFVLTIATPGLIGPFVHWMASGKVRIAAGCAVILLALQLLVPLLTRSVLSLPLIPAASRNIYEQQYQMGLFLRQYYGGKTIVANDIGAITFLADIHLVDLVGLASADVYRLRSSNGYNAESISQLCDARKACVAVVYELWLDNGGLAGIERTWKKAGTWKIKDAVVVGSNVVSFFATCPSEEEPLRNHLREFSEMLPVDVEY